MESVGWLDAEPALMPKTEKNPDGFDYDNNIHVLSESTFTLDGGGTLELSTNYSPSESEHITTVYSKDMNAFFTSDFGYNGVHLWMGTGVTDQHIDNWRAQLETFKSQYVRGNLKMYFIGRFENVLLIVCIYFPKLYFLL